MLNVFGPVVGAALSCEHGQRPPSTRTSLEFSSRHAAGGRTAPSIRTPVTCWIGRLGSVTDGKSHAPSHGQHDAQSSRVRAGQPDWSPLPTTRWLAQPQSTHGRTVVVQIPYWRPESRQRRFVAARNAQATSRPGVAVLQQSWSSVSVTQSSHGSERTVMVAPRRCRRSPSLRGSCPCTST